MGTKEDSVAARLTALQAAETQAQTEALGGAFDDGVASAPAGTGGGFTQADIDKAVQSAQAADAQALADAQAKAASDLAVVQQQLVDMTAKELSEEAVVTNLQQSVAAVQSSLDAIKALIFPAPTPAPAPAPSPVDPAPPTPAA